MAHRALRLFLGLPLPPDLCGALERWQQTQPEPQRWSRPEGLHVTLAFLGDRPEAEVSGVLEAVGPCAQRQSAFRLRTAGLNGFPNDRAARILWLGLEPLPALDAFAADLRMALAGAGQAFDPKPFRGHITLARSRRPLAPAAFTPPPPAVFDADRLVLFESRPGGIYGPVQAWPLRKV